jgi:hypothetical protein
MAVPGMTIVAMTSARAQAKPNSRPPRPRLLEQADGSYIFRFFLVQSGWEGLPTALS